MSKYGLVAGTQCYKYTLTSLLSNPANSLSDVWLAQDNATATQVALKVVAGAHHDIASRLYEAQVGSKLNHSNLCEVVGADVVDIPHATVNGQPAAGPFVLIGFQYQRSGSCTRLLTGPGIMRVDRVHKLLLDVLAGLEYLHEQGLHHNDIKPANILQDGRGNFLLTDYGIVWTATAAGVAPFYMPHVAPESIQLTGGVYVNNHQPCAATDIYQVGLTAYRLLNGADLISGAFQAHRSAGTSNTFFDSVRDGTLPDRDGYGPAIPQRLCQIVNKAIAPDPAERFTSALEMRREVEKLHFPKVWDYNASNELVLIDGDKTYQIEVSQQGSRFDVCAVATYPSGRQVRPLLHKKKGLSKRQKKAHVKKIMQALLKP